jgi:sporulation integral membrane protein YlbJ
MKHKFHFILLSFKRNILPLLFVLFTLCLVIFSKQNLQATKSGLQLWANSVVPSLLPFFIATELLSYTNITKKIGNLLNKYMKPIFNVPGIGAYALIMGIISGYPVGAKIVTKFRNDGVCTQAEAERLLAFTNNSGPLFIIGTVGISMYASTEIGILLFISHFISCILVGITFRFWKYNDKEQISSHNNTSTANTNVSFSNLGIILSKSILNSFNTIIMIGGFVIIFSVVISILNNCGFFKLMLLLLTPLFKNLGLPTNFIIPITSGIIELTNGLNLVSNIAQKSISTNIIISAFLLGFGGISVLLQVLSITSKSDISIKAYFIGKLLQGIFAAIITYILIQICPIFNLDIIWHK